MAYWCKICQMYKTLGYCPEHDKKPCNHKDKEENYTYEKEDNRCDTDRGVMGQVNFICTQCDQDITETIVNFLEITNDELDQEKEQENYDAQQRGD